MTWAASTPSPRLVINTRGFPAVRSGGRSHFPRHVCRRLFRGARATQTPSSKWQGHGLAEFSRPLSRATPQDRQRAVPCSVVDRGGPTSSPSLLGRSLRPLEHFDAAFRPLLRVEGRAEQTLLGFTGATATKLEIDDATCQKRKPDLRDFLDLLRGKSRPRRSCERMAHR